MRFTGSCQVCGQTYPLGFAHNCPGRRVYEAPELHKWTQADFPDSPARNQAPADSASPEERIAREKLDRVTSVDLLKAWEFYQAHKDQASVKPVTARKAVNKAAKQTRAEYQKRWREARAQKKETAV